MALESAIETLGRRIRRATPDYIYLDSQQAVLIRGASRVADLMYPCSCGRIAHNFVSLVQSSKHFIDKISREPLVLVIDGSCS